VTRGDAGGRRGFVLPLALFMLTVLGLLAALLLDASVAELRIARGEVAGARADAAAGSALSDALSVIPDSATFARPRGTLATLVVAAGAETTRVAVQALGGGLMRVTIEARVWSGGVRAEASNVGFMRILSDASGAPGTLRYQRLPGWWWARNP
jgi:Tfp pilus assembly protein PilX